MVAGKMIKLNGSVRFVMGVPQLSPSRKIVHEK